MSKKFSLFYAFRTIFSRNSGKVFRHIRGAVIGAAISLIPLVVVLEISDGMIQGIVERYIEISSYHIQVRLPIGTDKDSEAQIIDKIRALDNVKLAYSYTQGNGLLYSQSGRTGITVRGIPASVYSDDDGFSKYMTIINGEFSLDSNDSIVLSKETASQLKIEIGDTVKLLTAKSIPGRKMILKPTKLKVTGIYSSGYQDLDMMCAFISDEYGLKLFKDLEHGMVAVKIFDPYSSQLYSTASQIKKISLGTRVYTWEALNDSLMTTLGTTRKFLVFIMLLILLVASVNISSSMIMIVISKKQDIAILKSVGASEADISFIFMLHGFFIGTVAAFIGIALGILAAININQIIVAFEWIMNVIFDNDFKLLETGYYLEKIPVSLSFAKLAASGVLAVGFSVMASWFPAKKAGKIHPIEIFRKN